MTSHAAVLVLLFLTPMEAVQMKGGHASLKEISEESQPPSQQKTEKKWAQQMKTLQDQLSKQQTRPMSDFMKSLKETQQDLDKSSQALAKLQQGNQQKQKGPEMKDRAKSAQHLAALVNKSAQALEKAMQDNVQKQNDAATLPAKVFAESTQRYGGKLDQSSTAFTAAQQENLQKHYAAVNNPLDDKTKSALAKSSNALTKLMGKDQRNQDISATQPMADFVKAQQDTQKKLEMSSRVLAAARKNHAQKLIDAYTKPEKKVAEHIKMEQDQRSEALRKAQQEHAQKSEDALTKPIQAFQKAAKEEADQLKRLLSHTQEGKDFAKLAKSSAESLKKIQQGNAQTLKKNNAESLNKIHAAVTEARASARMEEKQKNKKQTGPMHFVNFDELKF